MRTSLIATSLGAELRINADGPVDDLYAFANHDFWPRFVPGAVVEVTEGSHNSDLSVSIDAATDWQFTPEDRSLTFSPNNTKNAICTAGYMLDAKRQALGLYTVHGNIITSSDNTVALVGPISGIGKTGLSSLATHKEWQWVSDEKFVMDDQGEYVGSVVGILQDAKSEQSAAGNEPGTTRPFSRKIGAFVIPIVTDSDALTVHTYERDKAFWHLYEEMSRDVRMTPMTLDGPEVPLPSFDSSELATRRRKVAVELSTRIPFVSVMGRGDAILNYISEPN